MDSKILNKYCLAEIRHYQGLKIAGKKINTPYFVNSVEQKFINLMRKSEIAEDKIDEFHRRYKNREIDYGWYLGKGTPEEIESAVSKICAVKSIDLKGTKEEVIIELMKLYGIGIDCSGLVYNTLSYAFRKSGKLQQFKKSLDWQDRSKQAASRAGVFVFEGSASKVISAVQAQPLDLICIDYADYRHIAILVEMGGKLKVAQSTIGTMPTGINVSGFSIKANDLPLFEYKSDEAGEWEKLYQNGKLKFRRLKVMLK